MARMFRRQGAIVLSADTMAHASMRRGKPCYQKIVRAFGKTILTQGEIDRRKLAHIVFNDPRALKKLNRIVHPAVIKDIRQKCVQLKKKKGIIVVDAVLLMESGLNRWMDYCVVVTATRKVQLQRALKQRPIRPADVLKRIKAQMSQKEKLQHADIVIDNNGPLKKTREQVKRIRQRLLTVVPPIKVLSREQPSRYWSSTMTLEGERPIRAREK